MGFYYFLQNRWFRVPPNEKKERKRVGDPRGRSFGRLRRRVENYEGERAFSIARLLHPATAVAAPALEEIPMYHSLFSLLTYLALLLLPPRPSLRLPLRQSGITGGGGRKRGGKQDQNLT